MQGPVPKMTFINNYLFFCKCNVSFEYVSLTPYNYLFKKPIYLIEKNPPIPPPPPLQNKKGGGTQKIPPNKQTSGYLSIERSRWKKEV